MTTAPNPRRKFYLLVALKVLGPDLSRRELSVADLEALAAKHNVDISAVPTR